MLVSAAHKDSWKNTDPRYTCSDDNLCYIDIVIVRPGPDTGEWVSGIGFIDINQEWYIHTNFPDHPTISMYDKWDEGWWWILGPPRNG